MSVQTRTDRRVMRLFGEAVKDARDRCSMSQEDLAEAAQLSRKDVSDIERGTRNPGLTVILRLAMALDVPVASLLSRCSPVVR